MSVKNETKTVRKHSPLVGGELSTLVLRTPESGATKTKIDTGKVDVEKNPILEDVDVCANEWATTEGRCLVTARAKGIRKKYDADRKRWVFVTTRTIEAGTEVLGIHEVTTSTRDAHKVETAMSDMGSIGQAEKDKREKARTQREAQSLFAKLEALGLSREDIQKMATK